MISCRFVDKVEFDALEKKRREHRLSFLDAFGAGAMYYCPWYHNPSNPEDMANLHAGYVKSFLSEYYIRDWAHIRPPTMVICPNGSLWCVDQKSTNGNGWIVTGNVPEISCSPSIVVSGYHGFLQNGVFTDNIG